MIWLWIGFVSLVLALLALDLGVFHRKAHVIGVKEALRWSAFWISLGVAFTIFVYFAYEHHWVGLGGTLDPADRIVNNGHTAAVKYLTGYVVEKSLSVDNIFVIAMIFAAFRVPPLYQHRVLFWGILGALVMRGAMIGIGAALIAQFHWILYLFGAFLIFTAVRMLFLNTEEHDLEKSFALRAARRVFPITSRYHGPHFLVRAGSRASHEAAMPGAPVVEDPAVDRAPPGTAMLTPLALALVVVESTDLLFAVDSIPAIFAITADPFLVFTSNVFAILGLRSLYFALAGMIARFRYLKPALALVLLLVGVKMLTAEWLKKMVGAGFNFWVLGAVFFILGVGIAASLVKTRGEAAGPLPGSRDATAADPGVPAPDLSPEKASAKE